MAEKFRDWVEPAHPAVVRQFEDLVRIYRVIQRELQERVDQTFDRVSSRIGFVVTTTLPATLRVGPKEGAVEAVQLPKTLSNTVFQQEFEPVVKELGQKRFADVTPGTYALYLVWYDALRLKLKTDWVEPAHLALGGIGEVARGVAVPVRPEVVEPAHWRDAGLDVAGLTALTRVRPDVIEPAHWFDAGAPIATIDEVIIAALDEVYVDLKLAARIQAVRQEARLRTPGVREPAHFRQILEEVLERFAGAQKGGAYATPQQAGGALAEVLRRPDANELVAELTAVLRKFGV